MWMKSLMLVLAVVVVVVVGVPCNRIGLLVRIEVLGCRLMMVVGLGCCTRMDSLVGVDGVRTCSVVVGELLLVDLLVDLLLVELISLN